MKNPMETCKALRGISCRCTKERQCLWIGIRPRGEGDRDMERQYDESAEAAEEGERWPLDSETAPSGGIFAGTDDFEAAASFCRLAWVFGLRLRARARFSRLESEEGESGSGSSDMGEGEFCLLAAAERVMGAK